MKAQKNTFSKIELEILKFRNFLLNSNTINSVQYIRALAAVSVVIFHIEGYVYRSPLIEINQKFLSWGSIGVQIFFVLSGFIIPFSIYKKERKPIPFIKSRLIRIYPTYFFILLFYLIVNFLVNNYLLVNTEHQIEFSKILYSLIFNLGKSTNGYIQVAWTLFYEFCFYLIFALVVQDFKKICNSNFFYASIIFLQVLFLLNKNFYLVCFVDGISIFLMMINPGNFKLKNPLYCNLLFIYIFTLFFYFKAFIASSILLLALITEYLNKNLYLNKLIQKIGDYSYSIYIVQEIIIAFSIKIISYLYKNLDLKNEFIFYILNTGLILYLVVISGFLLGKFVEKPTLKFLMKK